MKYIIENLTIRLHEKIREGVGDGEEADGIREEIMDNFDKLTVDEKILLNNLSGDLYLLDEPKDKENIEVALRHADRWGKLGYIKTEELFRIYANL